MSQVRGVAPLSTLKRVIGKPDAHQARVQFLRIAFRNYLVSDIMLGMLMEADLTGEDLTSCTSSLDGKDVVADLMRLARSDEFLMDAIRDQAPAEVFGMWSSLVACSMGAQGELFH